MREMKLCEAAHACHRAMSLKCFMDCISSAPAAAGDAHGSDRRTTAGTVERATRVSAAALAALATCAASAAAQPRPVGDERTSRCSSPSCVPSGPAAS